jgi:hypothetical protein
MNSGDRGENDELTQFMIGIGSGAAESEVVVTGLELRDTKV